MFEIFQSHTFTEWLSDLKDRQARMRILARLDRIAMSNLGNVQALGDGIFELRIHYGPGYRMYCMQRGKRLVVLLCGGDKSTQVRDIERAKSLTKEWKE